MAILAVADRTVSGEAQSTKGGSMLETHAADRGGGPLLGEKMAGRAAADETVSGAQNMKGRSMPETQTHIRNLLALRLPLLEASS